MLAIRCNAQPFPLVSTQMQHCSEPVHSGVLCPFQSYPLHFFVLIPPRGKPMSKLGKVLIVILEVQLRDLFVRICFQLGRESHVIFRGAYLHGYVDRIDFLLGQE